MSRPRERLLASSTRCWTSSSPSTAAGASVCRPFAVSAYRSELRSARARPPVRRPTAVQPDMRCKSASSRRAGIGRRPRATRTPRRPHRRSRRSGSAGISVPGRRCWSRSAGASRRVIRRTAADGGASVADAWPPPRRPPRRRRGLDHWWLPSPSDGRSPTPGPPRTYPGVTTAVAATSAAAVMAGGDRRGRSVRCP